jgi:hypothetical protein
LLLGEPNGKNRKQEKMLPVLYKHILDIKLFQKCTRMSFLFMQSNSRNFPEKDPFIGRNKNGKRYVRS